MRILLVPVIALLSVDAHSESFDAWKTRWDVERSSVLATYQNRIATAGLKAVYSDLQNQVGAIPATTEEERHWQRSFACAMQANLMIGESTDQLDAALQKSPEDKLSGESRELLKSSAEADRLLRGDPFSPVPPLLTPQYRLLIQGNTLLDAQCPNHEIVIDQDSQSFTAQQLYRTADILSTSVQNQRLPLMEATAAAIHASRIRWDAFFKNAMLDQYPWETYANEWGRHWLPALRGTLSQPPSAQIRIAHPTPVVVVDDSDGTSFEPSLAIEALGWRVYDHRTYQPRWGVSLVAVLKTSSEDSTGYGLLFVAKSFSFGAITRDTAQKSNDIQLMLGVDIAKLFNNQSGASHARATELDKVLNGILGCAVNGFATCSSP